MIIINAENQIVGRFATIVAKKLLLGEDVVVVNCDKAFVSGNKAHLKSEFIRRETQGEWSRGPHFPRQSHMIVKRIIRGMLPYKQGRGRDAFQKLKCYNGMPQEFAGKEHYTLSINTNIKKLPTLNYISLGEVSRLLGAKR